MTPPLFSNSTCHVLQSNPPTVFSNSFEPLLDQNYQFFIVGWTLHVCSRQGRYPIVLKLMIGITGFFSTCRLSRQWQCHTRALSIFQEAPVATTPMSWSDAIAKPPLGRQEGKGWIFGLDDLRSWFILCVWEILKQIVSYRCTCMQWNGMEWNAMHVCMYVCMYVCI